MPFGGVKASGCGRFGGTAGIAEFTELRWVTLQDGPLHYRFKPDASPAGWSRQRFSSISQPVSFLTALSLLFGLSNQ